MHPSKKLNINKVIKLSVQVSFTFQLIVQATLAQIYWILFSSVVSVYLISHYTRGTNNYINKSLFTDKRTRKITSFTNSVPSKCLKFPLRCLETSLAHYVKCINRGVFSVCSKKFFGALKELASNIYFSNMISLLTFIKVWLILIQKRKNFCNPSHPPTHP